MKPEFTTEELALIEAKRKRDENLNACREEVEAVLAKHNMNMKINFPSQPVIVLEQRA